MIKASKVITNCTGATSDNCSKISTSLDMAWRSYCLRLLKTSKKSIEKRREVSTSRRSDLSTKEFEEFGSVLLITDDNLPCRFPKDPKFECPDVKVSNYSDARKVFIVGQMSNINGMSNDNNAQYDSEAVLDLSKLYSLLAFYEGLEFLKENTYRRMSKMHKRRITLIKRVIGENTGKIL